MKLSSPPTTTSPPSLTYLPPLFSFPFSTLFFTLVYLLFIFIFNWFISHLLVYVSPVFSWCIISGWWWAYILKPYYLFSLPHPFLSLLAFLLASLKKKRKLFQSLFINIGFFSNCSVVFFSNLLLYPPTLCSWNICVYVCVWVSVWERERERERVHWESMSNVFVRFFEWVSLISSWLDGLLWLGWLRTELGGNGGYSIGICPCYSAGRREIIFGYVNI